MKDPIFFSKVEFQESHSLRRFDILFLNLQEKELTYQVFERKLKAPTIVEIRNVVFDDIEYPYDLSWPSMLISDEKTDFKPILLKGDEFEISELFSYGIKLTNEQMHDLLPYCNA